MVQSLALSSLISDRSGAASRRRGRLSRSWTLTVLTRLQGSSAWVSSPSTFVHSVCPMSVWNLIHIVHQYRYRRNRTVDLASAWWTSVRAARLNLCSPSFRPRFSICMYPLVGLIDARERKPQKVTLQKRKRKPSNSVDVRRNPSNSADRCYLRARPTCLSRARPPIRHDATEEPPASIHGYVLPEPGRRHRSLTSGAKTGPN